jgi:arylsulfatase A-like enzyme
MSPSPLARRLLVAIALLLGCSRGSSPAGSATPALGARPAPARTIAGPPPAREAEWLRIGGEHRHVLPRRPQEQELPLPAGTPVVRVRVALGLTPLENETGVVALRVGLRGDGVPDRVLQRIEARDVGWHDVTVDVDATGITNPRLLLARELVSGSIGRLLRSAVSVPSLSPPGASARPSVLLVSLDTLRADRVGAYGDTAARTPVLDGLARAGIMYTDAYSPAMWTLPSHAGLFYGTHLPDTPAGLASQGRAEAALGVPPLPLPELLRQHGYATAGFTGGGFLGLPFDFRRGFDTYYEFPQPNLNGGCPPERFDGAEVFRRADAWLRDNGERPFFLFVHTYDVHDRCPFLPPGAPGGFGSWPALDDAAQARLQAHYRDLIARADARLGALLRTLHEVGADRRTIVIVTSDHGEGLSEHDQRGHSCALRPYEELVRVPLLIRDPQRPGPERITVPVSLIDLAPTVLALLDVAPPDWMRGHLLPGLGLASPDPPAPVVVLCDRQLALRDGTDKLIATYESAATDELYDLAADPHEASNRAAAAPDTLAALRARAARTWQPSQFDHKGAAASPVQADTLDPAARERLRALGYLP